MAQLTTRKLSELFEDFLKTYQDKSKTYKYRERISELIASGGKSVVIDYDDMIHFNADLCDSLLQDPDRALQEFRKAAYETMSAENAPYADKVRRNIQVRIRGITDRVALRKVDTSHLDKMIAFSGMVVRTSELRPLLQDAAFVCPNEHVTMVAQEGQTIKRPVKCESCSESRSLELDQKRSKFIDSQSLRVQELPEELPPGQLPRFFDVDLEGDIVNTARPGDRLILTGIVRAEPDIGSPGQARMRAFRSKIESNYLEILGKEPGQIQITNEDEMLIRNIAKSQGAYQKLVSSIAPAIVGHEAVKEAILLLLCGSPLTTLPDNTKLRGDINVLLVGDPGVAKSEMLKFAAQVAPRGIFASGRGSTAAGLSAAVIREKNVFMLEAGVVVLADQGIASIDEFDKMRPEDRSALHEAMEQQSYHPSVEILFASGRKEEIGKFVERSLAGKESEVHLGKDCEILTLKEPAEIYAMDPSDASVGRCRIDRVSRHKAPDRFIGIRYSNGRSIIVTPEHPVFVSNGSSIKTLRAENVKVGDFAPTPRFVPNSSAQIMLNSEIEMARKKVDLPMTLTPELARILGYLVTEGNFHVSSGGYEVSFTNLEGLLLHDVTVLMAKMFNLEPLLGRSPKGEVGALRFVSKRLFQWFASNFPEIMTLARTKRAPAKLLGSSVALIGQFLSSAFLGDGGVESTAICYRTSSPGLAEDYQDLLLKLGISTRLVKDTSNDSFKVYIAGDSMPLFESSVLDPLDSRRVHIKVMMHRGQRTRRSHDVVPPEVAKDLVKLRKSLGIKYRTSFSTHLRRRHGITVDSLSAEVKEIAKKISRLEIAFRRPLSLRELRKEFGISQDTMAALTGLKRSAIYYLEVEGYAPEQRERLTTHIKHKMKEVLFEANGRLKVLMDLTRFRFLRIVEAVTIPNAGRQRTDWVYDVTVEPTHAFVSKGLMLHNTVTIAKGGIYASLNARTAILAAINPVLGKYDAYQNLTDNINLPIPLLSVGPDEQILIKRKDEIKSVKIGRFVDSFYSSGQQGFPIDTENNRIEVASMDENFKITWKPLRYVFRHTAEAETYRVQFKGRDLVLSGGHCVYILENGRLVLRPTNQLRIGDSIAIAKRLPAESKVHNKREKLAGVQKGPTTALSLVRKFGVNGGGGGQLSVRQMGDQGIQQRETIVGVSGRHYIYSLTEKGKTFDETVDYLDRLMLGDVAFVKIDEIARLESAELPKYVYDLSVPGSENFVADTAICHNTRFDLIFVIRDTPTPAQDELLASHILEVHRKRGFTTSPPVQFDLLKKYITFVKKTTPTLTREAEDRIKEYYLSLRRSTAEGQIGATPRTLESLIRVASARARLLLREQVLEEDALAAISLMRRMVEDVLTDAATQTRGDFGVLFGKPVGEKNKLSAAMQVFKQLEGEGSQRRPVEARLFREELIKNGKFTDEDADKLISNMLKEGIIYESKTGFFRRVGS